MSDAQFIIRQLVREDREWVAHFLDSHWGSTQLVTRGQAYYGHLLPGFVAEQPAALPEDSKEKGDDDATEENPTVHMEKVGLLTYHVEEKTCEILTLNSIREKQGVGTALVNELKKVAKENNIKRLWLITTNDNLPALRFWQKRGFELVTIYRDAIADARRLKPQIPITGINGIPIRDEIELELML